MRRRNFLGIVTAAIVAPVVGSHRAAAQKLHKIGWLHPGPASGAPPRIAALLKGLREAGFSSPEDIELIPRVADGDEARLMPMARELIERGVDVIVATSPPAIDTMLQAESITKSTVPIVALSLVSDPVDNEWVQSLARPTGNLTGLFLNFPEISKKWLQMLKEVAPDATKIAVFWVPAMGKMQRNAAEQAAQILKVELDFMAVRKRAEVENAFASARQRGAKAVLLLASPLVGGSAKLHADLALKYQLPAMTLFPRFAQVGGLMAYGPDLFDSYRQLGGITARILKGSKPADLPIVQHARFQLVVNRKTAMVLGLTIPPSILIRADHVIE